MFIQKCKKNHFQEQVGGLGNQTGETFTSKHFFLVPNLAPLFLQNISCASYRAIFCGTSKDLKIMVKVMATYMCVCLQSLQDDGDLRRPDEHGRYGPRKVSLMVLFQ